MQYVMSAGWEWKAHDTGNRVGYMYSFQFENTQYSEKETGYKRERHLKNNVSYRDFKAAMRNSLRA